MREVLLEEGNMTICVGPTEQLSNQPTTLRAWVVVLSAALFFFYEFIQMNMFNAIDPSLIRDFGVTATQLGNLSATYFYGNVLFLFITGMILDRFSTRKLLLLAISVCVICTYLFALSTTLFQGELCRFITGIASTYCMLSVVRLASRWFPVRRLALVIGVGLTFAMMGGVVAQTPMTLLTHAIGWRHAVMVNATLGVVFIILIARFVQDYPLNMQQAQLIEKMHLKELGFLKAIGLAVRNKQNWLAGLYGNFMSFPIVILGATWGSAYLMQVRNLTHEQSTYVTSMIFFGTIVGSPLAGWLSDRMRLRKGLMLVGAALTLGIMLFIMMLPHLDLFSLIILFFALGLIASTQVISFPLVVESNSRSITTTAEGLACTLIMSAGLFQLVYGWLLDLTWSGQMLHGARFYSAHSFQMATWMFPVVFLLSLLIAVFVKETHCRHQEH